MSQHVKPEDLFYLEIIDNLPIPYRYPVSRDQTVIERLWENKEYVERLVSVRKSRDRVLPYVPFWKPVSKLPGYYDTLKFDLNSHDE